VTSNTDTVSIACAANRAYVIPLTVMLRSAIDSLSAEQRLVAWVVDDGMGESLRQRVEESLPARGRIEWLDKPEARHDGLPLWGRMPSTTYQKITIAEVLPADLDKVIWLDCDMLVLADISELWNTPLDDSHLLAVTDVLIPTLGSRFGVTGWKTLGRKKNDGYFNAGMMVIDTARWRESHVSDAAIEYLKKFRDGIYFWDQQALNAVLSGLWREIEPRWNWSATLDRLPSTSLGTPSARIIHFNGYIKPWIVREAVPFDSEYFRVIDSTAWSGWRPQRTLARTALSWYGSSRVRRILYPAEQWGVNLIWHLTQRPA
jgi:lipopolysaccharide biosynthesis glycosyltransferase